MRVLHVSAYYAPAYVYGGPPRSIHALCRALRRTGVDVEVFTTDANGAAALPAAVTGCRTYEDVPVRYFPRSFPKSPIGSKALGAALRRELPHYDLVHIHGLWNRAVWAAAREASRAGVPYVVSPRGMLESAARAHRAWRKRATWALLDSRVIRRAALLHATSEGERDTLVELNAAVPVAFVPNGVDIGPRRRIAPAAPLVSFVGRIHPIKRLDVLVDAFALVREQRTDVRLAVAGPDEAGLRSALTARAGRHAEAIEWLGAIDEAQRRELLGRTSALVMCSDSESFGMSALEAIAAAVPVVVTRTCPWADLERHRAGYWVEQTPSAVAAGLTRILADPESARAMGERGRALAEARYQWDAIARTLAAEYHAVRSPRSAAAALPVTS